jgi:hypothetical protein
MQLHFSHLHFPHVHVPHFNLAPYRTAIELCAALAIPLGVSFAIFFLVNAAFSSGPRLGIPADQYTQTLLFR